MEQQIKRNTAIEVVKIIAACFVVFIHVQFSGKLGPAANCVGRFAVPFFFAISGYFSFGAGSRKLLQRGLKILRILLVSTVLYAAWGCFLQVYSGNDPLRYLADMLRKDKLAMWIFMNENPFSSHLWYLAAMLVVYGLYYLYVRFQEGVGKHPRYNLMYLLSFVLFLFFVLISLCLRSAGLTYHYTTYRNALFFGMPMFTMGLFLREYKDKIVEIFHLCTWKYLFLMILGSGLSILQWGGIGVTDMPVGILLIVIPLVLWLTGLDRRVPVKPGKFSVNLSNISLLIYVLHLLVHEWLQWFIRPLPLFTALLSDNRIYPLLLALLSLLIALLCSVFMAAVRWGMYRVRNRAKSNP